MALFRVSKTDGHHIGHPPGVLTDVAYTKARAWVWGTGASLGSFVAPAAGGVIDGVSMNIVGTNGGYVWVPGWPMAVELGGTVSAGVDLETLSDGRMVTRATGRVVMRALEGGSAGSIIWATCRS